MFPKIHTYDFPNDALNRLSKKMNLPLDNLLINKNICIAGGSIVWALLFLKDECLNDIDIFILDGIYNNLALSINNVNINNFDKCFYEQKSSTITVHFKNNVPLQFILSAEKTPTDLIKHFDFDYVQCALFFDKTFKLIISDWAIQAHQTKIVNHMLNIDYHTNILYNRACKALHKGFRFPDNIKNIKNFKISCDWNYPSASKLLNKNILYMDYHSIKNNCKTQNTYFSDLRTALEKIKYQKPIYYGNYESMIINRSIIKNPGYKILNDSEMTDNEMRNNEKNDIASIIDKILNNDNDETFQNSLIYLFNNKLFSDFKIISQDSKDFYVHKVILYQVQYFRTLFNSNNKESINNNVVLPFLSIDLEFILRHIYGQTVNNCLKKLEISPNLTFKIKILRYCDYLNYSKLINDIWLIHDSEIIESKDTEVTFEDLLLILRLARQYNFFIPKELNIQNYITDPNLNYDDLSYFLKQENMKTRIKLIAKWIELHPLDEKGHYNLLQLLKIKLKNDLRPFYKCAKTVNTKSLTDFILNCSKKLFWCNDESDESDNDTKKSESAIMEKDIDEREIEDHNIDEKDDEDDIESEEQ